MLTNSDIRIIIDLLVIIVIIVCHGICLIDSYKGNVNPGLYDAIQFAGPSLPSYSVETGNGYRFGEGLWRILRPDENPEDGLTAKDPQAKKSVLSHVNCGCRKGYASQYISTTASYKVAQNRKTVEESKGLTGLRIAEIDLNALPKDCKLKIVDLTTEENRDEYLGNAVCKNFAKASCEVLLECDVPIPCYVVDPPELNCERFKKALLTWLLYGVSSMTV